jgi:hypothetical protein
MPILVEYRQMLQNVLQMNNLRCAFSQPLQRIDELYRIGGISRKYFRRLASVFYVPNQVVPRIGAQPPYSNALPTVTVEQKHKNRNSNLMLQDVLQMRNLCCTFSQPLQRCEVVTL